VENAAAKPELKGAAVKDVPTPKDEEKYGILFKS
jgi:hypothetical protein